jgi:putative acetyltransferase
MSDTFQIRSASNEDAPAIRTLVFEILREHCLAPDPGATDADLDDIEGHYVHRGGCFDVLVESRTGRIIGCAGLDPAGDGRCELRKMYLDANFRGQGLGRLLLEHALHQAQRFGFRRIELETASVLSAARSLYESYGFRSFQPDHLSSRCDQAYFLEFNSSSSL